MILNRYDQQSRFGLVRWQSGEARNNYGGPGKDERLQFDSQWYEYLQSECLPDTM